MDELLDDERLTALGLLIEAHAHLSRVLEHELLEGAGLPLSWYGVLVRLGRSPGRHLRMSELAEQMSISTSGLTRLIDRIETAGLVRRESCPTDRRGWFAVLTPEGEARLREATPLHLRGVEEHLTGLLSPGELADLTGALRKVRDDGRRQVGDDDQERP